MLQSDVYKSQLPILCKRTLVLRMNQSDTSLSGDVTRETQLCHVTYIFTAEDQASQGTAVVVSAVVIF